MSLNVVFMGTPNFAVPVLQMLIDEGYCINACVTQPDRPCGRGHKLAPPPVKLLAEQHGIRVVQMCKISSDEGVEILQELEPDVLITAAFGQILSDRVLEIPKFGCINVHASLLPKYRGSAPINWAIINGEKQTGITTMYTVKKLDAGDILEQDIVDITENMTAEELYEQLRHKGAQTLKRTLEKLIADTLERRPQIEEESTYYPMFKKGFGEVDFGMSSEDIHNFVRGINPFPGAYVTYKDEKIKIYSIMASNYSAPNAQVGEIVMADPKEGLLIKSGDGVVALSCIKRSCSRMMDAGECLRGRGMEAGYVFSRPNSDGENN